MTEQLPPIDVGSPVSATNPASEDDTYFDKYVEDKSQKPPSFIDRAYDTARAAYYRDTISGIAEAKEQSGFSTLYPEQFPEKFGYDLKLIEAAKNSTAPNAPMTQAELAQLRNKAYPEASSVDEKAADIVGGLVGGSASPETFALPAVKGLSAVKATPVIGSVSTFAEKYLPGMAYRAVDTGAGQAALMATVNPIIQNGRISAGLQREFDPWELVRAPFEGFVVGAGLHVGFEVGGKVAGKAAQAFAYSPTGKSMMQGFERRVSERIMERIKEADAGFRAPSDLPPPVAAAGEGNFEVRTMEGQTPGGVSTGTDVVPAAGTFSSTSIATETPKSTRLSASEMLSDMDGALGSGSIDTMRFDAPPKTEELDALIEAGQSREDKQIDRIFGDDAENVKGLLRKNRIDEVDDIIYKKFGSYDTPEAKEANGIIYGTDNYSIINTESLQSLRDRLSNLEFAVHDAANGDAKELAKELAWVAPELPDISAPETSHTETQRIAVLSLARAIEDMRANNIDPYPILKETVDYTVKRVNGDLDDASVLLERLSQYAERYMDLGGAKKPAEQPAAMLPPPTVAEAQATAGESLVRRGADNNVYLGNLRMQFYPDHVFYIVKDGPDLSIYKDGAFKPNRENEIYASEAIQRGVPKEIANSIANFLDTPKASQEGAIQDTIKALDNLVKSHLSEKNKQPQASQPAVEPPPPAVAEAQAAAKTIEDIPPEDRRAVIPALTPEANALSAPTTEGGPAGIFMFNPTELNVDAKRFQFKEGGDEQGVTNTLKSVSKWDQAKGNQVIVWQDNAGKLFVVDGHQRSGLARRLIESGKEQDIQLPGLLYREADGVSAETVRAIAAVKNIAEGSGSALDGAKVLRSNPELMDGSLPLSAGKSRQAFNLSRLGDEPFRMVINDVVPENYGAVVGERIPNDPARQEAAIKAIARFEPRNEAEAAVLVQRVAQAELAKAEEGAQGSMFGDLESADSTAGEEMRIVGRAIAELKKDKSLFTRVVANADRIEQTGSKIEQEAAADVRNEAELFAKQLASDAYTPGPLRDKLVEAAKELRDGKIEIGEATTRIRSALRAAAKERSAARFGDSEGGMASVERPASEKTAAGDQTLIPGVRAVTDADRIALEQGRPLAGGNEPAGGLFDEANTAQGDFLAGPIEDRGMQFRTRGPSYPPAEAARVAEAHDGIIRSLQQQSFDLAAKLGMPLREGRVQGGRYSLGQFESKFGVARVRQIGDFLTVAHEAGHAIEQRVGGDLTNLMNQHAQELAKLDPAGEGSVSEGFAEWLVKYIMNPASAMNAAPTFTPRFTEFMTARDPAIMDAIVQASNNYNALLTAPTPVQLGASITSVEPQGWFRGLIQSYKENGLAPTIGRVLADAYTATLDEHDSLTRATRYFTRLIYEANGKQLVDLKAGQRPDVLMRMWFARSAQGAAYQFRYGIVPDRGVTPNGPSLHDAISVATGEPGLLGRWDSAKVDEFGLFLAIERAEVLIERYNAGDFGERYPLPDNWTSGNVQNAKAALLAENPQYEQAAQMVHDFTQQLLKKQFDGGIIDRELYNKLSETPFYVPMFRDVADKPLSAAKPGASPDGPGMTDTIKTLRGSSRDIINPLQGIMQQTFLVERTLRHNDVIRSFVDLAKRAGAPAGYLVEPVPANEVRAISFDVRSSIERLAKESGIPDYDAELLMSSINNIFGEDPLLGTMFKNAPTKKRGEPIVFYKEAGELKAVRLMSGKEGMAIYESMMSLPTAGKDIPAQVMQAAGNIQRAGIVFEPTFLISNYIRDQMAVSILRPDYIPFWDGAKGVWSEATQDEAAQLYGYFGGQSAGGAVNEAVGMSVDASLDDLARKTWIQQRTKSPLAFIEATQLSEAGVRNSIFAKVYEQKLSAGMSPYEAAMEAAWAGTDILDFSRHGSKTFLARQLTPFWNANIQALDKARRAMIEPLYRAAKGDILTVQEKQEVANAYGTMFKAAAVGSALGAIWAAVNNEDEYYLNADPKTKATHFMFTLGGVHWRIPKPFELSLGFTFGEEAFASLHNKDPRAAANFVTAAWELLVPPFPIFGNPLIKAFYEGATGVDTYTGRDIVPDNMKKFNETPHLQYNERTAPLAVGISQASKVLSDYLNQATGEAFGSVKPFSPIKVEHMFGTGFGTTGRDMMAASHWFNPSQDSAPAQFENTVFLRRYMNDPTRSSDAITRYYQHVADKTGDYSNAKSAYDSLIKGRRVADARELYNGLKADQKAYVTLASAGTEDGDAAFDEKDRRIHPMTRAQNAVRELNDIARQIGNNTQANSETGQSLNLTRPQRKSAIEAIHQLGAQEMRNALVMTNEPGYEGRNLLDVNKQYAVIKAISPDLAEEVGRRYAMAGVFRTDMVAKNWPAARKELIKSGSDADIADITGDISDEGFEFGAEKIKRPRKLRLQMQGQPVIQ